MFVCVLPIMLRVLTRYINLLNMLSYLHQTSNDKMSNDTEKML